MPEFNPDKVVDEYRRIVADMARLAQRATELRAEWKKWNGDDELAEVAADDFGEHAGDDE